jgi:hypothetical protein
LYAALRLLESQVLELVDERREDAGAAALRVLDSDNQMAATDRELAIRLEGQASGLFESLELIQAAMPRDASYMSPVRRRSP